MHDNTEENVSISKRSLAGLLNDAARAESAEKNIGDVYERLDNSNQECERLRNELADLRYERGTLIRSVELLSASVQGMPREEQVAKIRTLFAAMAKKEWIAAIKATRDLSGLDLGEAKELVVSVLGPIA